ncbi:hypothetical protein C1H46_022331 [Malus baccata]|uniref:Uncharacterized protein n=1 Tax=Malus baccata TaxID=106549 RepID=A0A540M0N0_MALBA|nr:hypothetical protein C1H46_022331 [Malus baccata]
MSDVGFESKQGRLVCGDVGCCCRHNEATKKAVQQRQQQIRTPKWRGLSSSLHEYVAFNPRLKSACGEASKKLIEVNVPFEELRGQKAS